MNFTLLMLYTTSVIMHYRTNFSHLTF